MSAAVSIGSRRATRLGLGGCPLGGHGWGDVDDQQSIRAVHAALDAGINFFDTADVYGLGHSERLLSTALGSRRNDVLIGTKFGVRRTPEGSTIRDIRPAYLVEALEASLRRLRVECLSLYSVHWPDGTTPVEEAVDALERCRQQGKIEAIGVCNFNAEQLEAACSVAAIATNQVQYSLVEESAAAAVASVSRRLGVPLTTWGSLGQGILSGKFDAATRFNASDRRHRYPNFIGERFQHNLRLAECLKSIAGRLQKTPSQVALRWLLDTPGVGCVLFGAKTAAQVRENAVADDVWELPADDYRQLERLSRMPAATEPESPQAA